jgi:hypothetical protein
MGWGMAIRDPRSGRNLSWIQKQPPLGNPYQTSLQPTQAEQPPVCLTSLLFLLLCGFITNRSPQLNHLIKSEWLSLFWISRAAFSSLFVHGIVRGGDFRARHSAHCLRMASSKEGIFARGIQFTVCAWRRPRSGCRRVGTARWSAGWPFPPPCPLGGWRNASAGSQAVGTGSWEHTSSVIWLCSVPDP